MTDENIIGKGTWIDKLAYELLEREKQLGRSLDIIKVESGLGASGIPHIGSLGDAVRAYGVKLALENFGYKSELIAYSDDLDGLRKIPDGFSDSLNEHIAKPVSNIPDPFGRHDSYGEHMSSLLLEGLDELNIKYEFKRAKDTYQNGLLYEQIHKILTNSTKIGRRISDMVGQDKFEYNLPYFPICEQCGRLYTAKATKYLEDEKKVVYECQNADIGGKTIQGCGYCGEADIQRDQGKLAWKTEFAARWQAFDVRFEAYGKDIMDSVKINDWVADEILKYPHPHHIRYEMFLDKGGKKISKSSGNVVTSQRWLKYGTPESILLLLYKRITGARELGFEDIPSLMDEYVELQDIFFAKSDTQDIKTAKLKGLFEYVSLLNPPKAPGPRVSYRLLIELTKIFKEDRVGRVMKKLIDYGVIKEPDKRVEKIIELAGNYADEFGTDDKPVQIEIDGQTKAALVELSDLLISDSMPEDLQNSIYQIAKSHEIKPRDFFQILYKIILDTTRGPKMGPFISDIGAKKVGLSIREHI